jgi:hypothetical protein
LQFMLYYRRNFKANSQPRDKHVLRQHFHGKLRSCESSLR